MLLRHLWPHGVGRQPLSLPQRANLAPPLASVGRVIHREPRHNVPRGHQYLIADQVARPDLLLAGRITDVDLGYSGSIKPHLALPPPHTPTALAGPPSHLVCDHDFLLLPRGGRDQRGQR
jgi:hypothetical protein